MYELWNWKSASSKNQNKIGLTWKNYGSVLYSFSWELGDFFKFFWPSQNLWTLLSVTKMFYLPKITCWKVRHIPKYVISKVFLFFLTKTFLGEKPDGKTMAVNLHFYLTFNTMLTVIINTFLQDSSFFTAKKRRSGKKLHQESLWPLFDFFVQTHLHFKYTRVKNQKKSTQVSRAGLL